MARRKRPPRAGALSELQPLRIAAQIALLQLLYYAAAAVLLLFTALVAGLPFGPGLVLGWDAVRGDTTTGWLLAFVWLLDGGLCMAVAMVALVARSRLVPDFGLTTHLLHLALTTLYSRALPRHALWWAAMLAAAALGVALASWGCRYRELQPVFFGGRRLLAATAAAAPPADAAGLEAAPPDDDDDDDDDDAAGLRAVRPARDGAREYEMVRMQRAA